MRPEHSMLEHAPDNALVSILKHAIGIFFFLFSTSMAIWLFISVLAPFIAGWMGKSKDFVEYLHSVQTYEAKHANMANWSNDIFPNAWPYRFSVRIVNNIIPDNTALTTSSEDKKREEQAELEKARQNELDKNDSAARGNKLNALYAKISRWADDNFYPIQRSFLIVYFTRLFYALYIFALVFMGFLACWFVGEHLARRSAQNGEQPLGARHKWWTWVLKFTGTMIPSYCAFPIAAPSVLIMVILFGLALYAMVWMRAYFVEF